MIFQNLYNQLQKIFVFDPLAKYQKQKKYVHRLFSKDSVHTLIDLSIKIFGNVGNVFPPILLRKFGIIQLVFQSMLFASFD